MPPHLIVLQWLAIPMLVFLSQCLYWPIPFRFAAPPQLAYVALTLKTMRCVKCVLLAPQIVKGTQQLCHKVQVISDVLVTILLWSLPPVDMCSNDGSSSSSSCSNMGPNDCNSRSRELVLYFCFLAIGLVLPLYIMYVQELYQKQNFLAARPFQEHASSSSSKGGFLLRNLRGQGFYAHVYVLGTLVMLCIAAAELLLVVFPAPACGELAVE